MKTIPLFEYCTEMPFERQLYTPDFQENSFFFKVHKNYIDFFESVGITGDLLEIYANPLHNSTVFESHLYFVCTSIGNDYYIIDKNELQKREPEWTVDSLSNYLIQQEYSAEYLLESVLTQLQLSLEEDHQQEISEIIERIQQKLQTL